MTPTKTVTFSSSISANTQLTKGVCTLYMMRNGQPVNYGSLDVTGTDFHMGFPSDGSTRFYYAVLDISNYQKDGAAHSTGDRNIQLVAVFDNMANKVMLSPGSTIASAYAFARMTTITDYGKQIDIAGDELKLKIGHGMKNNFYRSAGGISDVLSSSPNGLETNSYPMFNSLCNIFYYGLTESQVYTDFLKYAAGTKPCHSFFQALGYLACDPFSHAKDIYELTSTKKQVYEPSLVSISLPGDFQRIPYHWSLSIKANKSGAENFLIAGTAFVVFDKEGKAWIANNFRAGTPNSGTHCIVLNADGSPADISPLTGGGILGPGFGIAISPDKENIAIGNFGWGPVEYNPQHGSVSMFTYDGKVTSPPNGFIEGNFARVQGMCYDRFGNLWMCCIGTQKPLAPAPDPSYNFESVNSAVVVYIGGDPKNVVTFTDFVNGPSDEHGPFGVDVNESGQAFVSTMGTKDTDYYSAVYLLELDTVKKKITCPKYWVSNYTNSFEDFRQVQINSRGEVYVGGITSSRVIKFTSNLNYLGELKNDIHAPWGVVFDADDKMFVANFGHEKNRGSNPDSLDADGHFGVTIITNDNDADARFLNLPSGGNEVMLANGMPLYGRQDASGNHYKCYQPLMRLTSTNIDAAGNLWCMNNWKPSALVDVELNPGGDGVVIFVGVAQPF